MKKEEKVTIITPVYNGEKYIERCIKSVLDQSYNNIEHIIIDDGSQDATLEICKKYSDKIILIHKENEGVSKARNTGLSKATGKYVLFADADDWLEPEMCTKMVEEIQKSSCDVVVCSYNNYYENENRSEEVHLAKQDNRNFLELITDDKSNYGGFPWNKLIRKELIKNNFNEKVHYYENLLFFLENCTEKTSFTTIDECMYNYCINDNSAVHSKTYSIKKVSALESLKKAIELLPESTKIKHKQYFINSYFNNLYFIKKYMREEISKVEVYKNDMKEYYKNIMKSSEITTKEKFKIFCMRRLNFIYNIYKNKKEK